MSTEYVNELQQRLAEINSWEGPLNSTPAFPTMPSEQSPAAATQANKQHNADTYTAYSCFDGGFTNHHNLECGHTITTYPLFPIAGKLPCGPTCAPYALPLSAELPRKSFDSISEAPFVCSTCIETFIRDNYDMVAYLCKNPILTSTPRREHFSVF
jgi:hypothetical protein